MSPPRRRGQAQRTGWSPAPGVGPRKRNLRRGFGIRVGFFDRIHRITGIEEESARGETEAFPGTPKTFGVQETSHRPPRHAHARQAKGSRVEITHGGQTEGRIRGPMGIGPHRIRLSCLETQTSDPPPGEGRPNTESTDSGRGAYSVCSSRSPLRSLRPLRENSLLPGPPICLPLRSEPRTVLRDLRGQIRCLGLTPMRATRGKPSLLRLCPSAGSGQSRAAPRGCSPVGKCGAR